MEKSDIDSKKRWRLLRRPLGYLLIIPAVFFLILLTLRFANPPLTPQMIYAAMVYRVPERQWLPLHAVPEGLQYGVTASIDANFCRHWGLDYYSARLDTTAKEDTTITISQRAVESLFLWPSKSYVTQVVATPLVLLAEIFWSKRRIYELYLNTVRLGPATFGVWAGARHFFATDVSDLDEEEIAIFTVVLADPSTEHPDDLSLEQFDAVISLMGRLSHANAENDYPCLQS